MAKLYRPPTVILYGIGGYANYSVLAHMIIPRGELTIQNLLYEAGEMIEHHPSVMQVYAIDNTSDLRSLYFKTARNNLMEDWVCFIDNLRREGVLVLDR